MARATWSGYLSFGLVNIPVGLYTATEDQTIHFNQLHAGTSHRVRYKKVDEETGQELSSEDIVNGYPLGGGEYVVVTPDEMTRAAPGKSELIEIQDFVELSTIDPIFFRQSYYLAPHGKGSDRAYALLLETLRVTQKVGIATLVLRDKEHLVAIRPSENVLVLETMYFEDEIREPEDELDSLPKIGEVNARELTVAKQLVNSLSDEWNPARYKNRYRSRVEDLIEKKRSGNSVVFQKEDSPKSNVVDLMSALQASMKRSGSTQRSNTTSMKKASPARSATRRGGDDLERMTRAELLERASKMKLAVTTKMTKAELVRVLSRTTNVKKSGRKVS